MDKIDWKRKFSSRKFWAALGAWIASLLIAFGAKDITVEQVGVIVSGMGALAVYMLSEGMADAKGGGKDAGD